MNYTYSNADRLLTEDGPWDSDTVTNFYSTDVEAPAILREAGVSRSWTLLSTTRYVYDGMRVIQERDGNNTPTVTYTRGTDLSGSLEGAGGIGGLLARSHGYSSGNWTTHNFYHTDGNGNVTYLVDASQALAASYRYDPFGNITASSGSLATANTYRFSSKMIHHDSALYYYGYRWYAPSLQRWLNRDPIEEEGGCNLFGFCGNAPVDNFDPTGERFGYGICNDKEWERCFERCQLKGPGYICINCSAFYNLIITPFGISYIRLTVCLCWKYPVVQRPTTTSS